MFEICNLESTTFSISSILEVDVVGETSGSCDEPIALIESFSQPFPTRARGNPVADGEMVIYGQDTASIRLYG